MSRGERAFSTLLALAWWLCGCGSPAQGIRGDAGAAACGSCHATEFSAWSSSGLASSGGSPVFMALTASARTAWGAAAGARCTACHQPGFGGDHGIGCVACHSATGNLADRDGLLTVDLHAPVSGPFSDPLATPAHESRAYPLLKSPVLCATCHEITGPALFRETTPDEYGASTAASEGVTCATCHMPAMDPGPVALGETNARPRADHSFVGLDPPWGASPEVQASAASRTLGLLQSALTLTAVSATSGEGLIVTVKNLAGHAVPTGVTFLRSIWVDVQLTAADGVTQTVASVIQLGAQPTLDGAPVALITEADAVEPNELAAGGSLSVPVPFPPTLSPPIRAVVTLSAEAVRADVLDALGLSDLASQVPTHEVAVVTVP